MSQIFLEHGLPASVDAERTILGAILNDNEVFFDELADLNAEDFSLDSNRIIFRTINEIMFGMVDGVTSVDIITLSNELERRRELQAIGNRAYLFSLTENLPRRLSVTEYVSIVRDKAKLRKIMGICSSTQARCADQGEDADRIREDMEAALLEVAAEGDSGAVKIGSVTPEVEKKVERSRSITEERTALELTWGLKGLDDLTKGLFGGELTVLSGESGGGKTIELMQIILANAQEGTPCGLFSMEMPKEKIVQRCYPAMSEVLTADMMRDPRLINLHTHVPEMQKMSAEIGRLPIWIDDTSPLHVNKLVARIRMMIRKYGIRLFGIDYLQLIKHSERTEVDGTRDVVFKLRDLVKSEPTAHLVLLSQYSKADGFSKNRKRTKGDLYGGSAIHHAAQNVVLIKVEDPEDKEPNAYLDVEFRIDKQRDGRVGKVPCMLDRSHLRFMHPQPALR